MSRLLAAGWLLGAAVLAPRPAMGQPATGVLTATTTSGATAAATRRTYRSQSIGVPDRGHLRNGATLSAGPHLFVRANRRSATFGTGELVGLIQRVAEQVASARPGGHRLVVGDLSRRGGGHLSPHRSHRSGRDADIGFYLVDSSGAPSEPPHFVQLRRRNQCGELRGQDYCFDAARNWDLIAAMVQDPIARLQYVLVAPDIRRVLLAEGERRGVEESLLERVRTVTEPHSGSHSHRSHFHIRIYCPVDDRPDCVDEPPYHDWYEGTPSTPSPGVWSLRRRQRRAAQRRSTSRVARRRAVQRRTRARARSRREARQARAAARRSRARAQRDRARTRRQRQRGASARGRSRSRQRDRE